MKQAATKTPLAGKPRAHRAPARAYMVLIDAFPLRPLRSVRDYNAAAAILDTLAVRAEGSLDDGEQDYLDTLTLLVEDYDREHFRFPKSEVDDPLAILKHLMGESGMTQSDLGRLLGNRSLASLILNGHRQLSKTQIRKLATRFKVSPALFLRSETTSVGFKVTT